MRRRVVCPRSHPASLYTHRLSVGFAMARGAFPGDTLRTPSRPLLAELYLPDRARATPRLRPGIGCPQRSRDDPGPARRASRGTPCGRCGPPAARPSPGAGGPFEATAGVLRGHLRWLLGPCCRIFASKTLVAPHLRFETGGGAAYSFLACCGCRLGPAPPRGGRSRPGVGLWRLPSFGMHPSRHVHVPLARCSLAHTHMTLRLRRAAIAAERLPCVARKAILARWYTTGSRRGCQPGKQCTAGAHTIAAISPPQTWVCSVWPNPNLNENLTTPAY